jgi:raffinose/stachyose/melibiose transport system permease protein
MKKIFTQKNLYFEIIMILISLLFVIPLWVVIINSFKTAPQAALLDIGIPTQFHFENYVKVFQEANIVQAFFNGMLYCSVVVFVAMIFTSMASFVITRIKSRITEISYYIFVGGIILPQAIVATYFEIHGLGLQDTYWACILVLLSMVMPLSVFLYTGYMKNIPRELDEAGTIDGAGKLRLFFSIIFPLLKPVSITIGVLNFMGVWNDVTTQLYFVNGDKWTMPMMVYRFGGQYNMQWNLIFADMILTSIPVLVIYAVCQKYIVSGVTTGAVKG